MKFLMILARTGSNFQKNYPKCISAFLMDLCSFKKEFPHFKVDL